MEIKLGYSNMGWNCAEEVTVRTRVCSASNRKTLGLVVDIGEKRRRYPNGSNTDRVVGKVEVFWMTGPKKGTREWKNTQDLVNYDDYKERIRRAVEELEKNEALAAKTGL